VPRDGDLIKRTPGTPLSEAELRQRREAARARWALAAGAAIGGGAVGAAMANREIKGRRKEAWAEVRRAQHETVGAERARHAAVIRRMEQVHETGRRAVSHGWPVPIYRSVLNHDINRTKREIRAMPAEFMGFNSDFDAAWAPYDQDKLRSFFDEIDRLKGRVNELADARKPRSVPRKGGMARVPEAHSRTIKRRAAPEPARIKVAETQLERARQALEALRGADAEAGLDDMEVGDNFRQVHEAAERRVRSAEAKLEQERSGRVIKDTVKVGARRSADAAERKVVRQGGRMRVEGNPDDRTLKQMRRELLNRLRAWHGDRVGREHFRHIQAMPVARAHARGRFSAALSQVPGKALRGKLIGAAGLLGGALAGAAAYTAYRPSRVEKLAKVFEEARHRRDARGRFAPTAPQAMVLIGPPAAGKTTWRTAYLARATRPTTVVSMDDAIADMATERKLSLRQAYNADRNTLHEVERGARARWRDAMARGDDVILDRTNARAKARGRWMRSVPPHYRKVAVVFDTPPDEMARRRAERPPELLPGRWQKPEEIEAGLQPPQRGEFHRVRRVAFRPQPAQQLAKFAAAPDPADVLQDAGGEAEQTIGERLANAFRRWRDAPAAELLEHGADLKADIERGLRRAIAPVTEAMNRGAGAVPRMADVTPDEAMSVVFSFDARNPRVAAYIEQYREQRVRELADEQADTIRSTILAGAMTGASTETMARQVRESIGLTAAQAAQVSNYRAQLAALDPRALQRQLRDRRFDPTVLRAIREGSPLSDEQVEKMVAAYHRRYLAYRATTIARTEGVGAANNGHVAALKDWLAQNPNYTVVKTWIATQDARTRPDHVHLHGQVVSGIDSPFRCDNGDTIRWPGDQDAPARQTINCRCTLSTRIVPRVQPVDLSAYGDGE
jgi:predicted kinase